MDMPTALVTGARRGIGRAIVERSPAPAGRSSPGSATNSRPERPAEAGGRITPVQLDITDQAQVDALADVLPDASTHWSTTQLSACWARSRGSRWQICGGSSRSTSSARWPSRKPCSRDCAAHEDGSCSSPRRAAGRSCPWRAPTARSKFALEAIADALRVELRPWSIPVSVIEPGPTDTEAWREVETMIDDMERRLSPRNHELYALHVAGLRRNISRFGSATTPPDAVARTVERALTAHRPRARYPVGGPAHAIIAMNALLPTRTGDAIGARIAGLT